MLWSLSSLAPPLHPYQGRCFCLLTIFHDLCLSDSRCSWWHQPEQLPSDQQLCWSSAAVRNQRLFWVTTLARDRSVCVCRLLQCQVKICCPIYYLLLTLLCCFNSQNTYFWFVHFENSSQLSTSFHLIHRLVISLAIYLICMNIIVYKHVFSFSIYSVSEHNFQDFLIIQHIQSKIMSI